MIPRPLPRQVVSGDSDCGDDASSFDSAEYLRVYGQEQGDER